MMAKATEEKNKVILKVGYTEFVVDYDTGAQVFSLLAGTGLEVFENKYDSETKKSYPIVRPSGQGDLSLLGLNKEVYAVGRLTHAAEQKSKGEA
jgi:hypothetical protein